MNWFDQMWLDQRFKCRYQNLNKIVSELCKREFSRCHTVSFIKEEPYIKCENKIIKAEAGRETVVVKSEKRVRFVKSCEEESNQSMEEQDRVDEKR